MNIQGKNLSAYFIGQMSLFLKNIFENRNNYYLIKICSLSLNESSGELSIKYQFTNKRICSEISLNNFLNSPLIHLVHPQQLYYLGFDTKELIENFSKKMKASDISSIKSKIARFKRFFTKENEN